jgi:hypothetical protein
MVQQSRELGAPLTLPWRERAKPLGGRAAAAHVGCCVFLCCGHEHTPVHGPSCCGFRNFTPKCPILVIWLLSGKSRFAEKCEISYDFPPLLGPIPISPSNFQAFAQRCEKMGLINTSTS